MDLDEGDTIPLPCRRCSSVSLEFMICASIHSLECKKCGHATAVTVERCGAGWEIRSAVSEGNIAS